MLSNRCDHIRAYILGNMLQPSQTSCIIKDVETGHSEILYLFRSRLKLRVCKIRFSPFLNVSNQLHTGLLLRAGLESVEFSACHVMAYRVSKGCGFYG